MQKTRKITGGLYLVVNPSKEDFTTMLSKIEQAVEGGINVIQLLDYWNKDVDKIGVINSVCELAHQNNIPVMINNNPELLVTTGADGVHFDTVPDWTNKMKILSEKYLFGITCTNDLSVVKWAEVNNLDYISFCSVFRTKSAVSCEIVCHDSIQKARKIFSLPIFLAGGVDLNNMKDLSDLEFDGIAMISSIMDAEDITQTTKSFKQKLKKLICHYENRND